MSVKGTRLTIGKASLAVGAGLLGLSLMSVMTADDGPPDAVLAEMQSTTKELAEKVGGAVAGASGDAYGSLQLLVAAPRDRSLRCLHAVRDRLNGELSQRGAADARAKRR